MVFLAEITQHGFCLFEYACIMQGKTFLQELLQFVSSHLLCLE